MFLHYIKNNQNRNMTEKQKIILCEISDEFSNVDICLLDTEEKILSYFVTNEENILNIIKNKFNNDKDLIEFSEKKIEEIFKLNGFITKITKNIYLSFEDIDIRNIESKEEYLNILKTIFPGQTLPNFLINKYWIKISYYIEKKNYVTSYISNTLYNNELSTKINGLSFFDIYKLTKEKKMNALYGINDDIKKNLLDLFLIINNLILEHFLIF